MAIVTLHLPAVKASAESRPAQCPYCASPLLQRWGRVTKAVKDPHVQQAQVYRYRCCQCGRTFRHYPEGLTSARQSQRLVVLVALCWVLGLSLRGTSAILSVFPVALSHEQLPQVYRRLEGILDDLNARLRGIHLDRHNIEALVRKR